MDRRNRAGQIVRLGRQNFQGEETDRSFGLTDEILKAKRRNARGASKGRGPAGWGQHGWGKMRGSSTGGGMKGGVFFFFFFFSFFLGPPSFSWGWLEWRSHGLPTLVKKKEKKSKHFECMLSLPIVFGVVCVCVFLFFWDIALKRWTIILTTGQHCHFLIFAFEMHARENEEEDPCMKILLKEMKSWEMIVPF
jgi:hypothetical protein